MLGFVFFTVSGACGTAAAQQGAVQSLRDEIVVTATKKKNAEDVQDIALSVSAFNSETLDALNVQDLQDLTFTTPNVALDSVGTFRGFAGFSIRGLGVASSIPSIDPSVGVFVDGVFLGLNNAVIFDTFDLEAIEILRGPQGLLFGRNTTGGAVVVNTANPTDEFTAKFKGAIEQPVGRGFGGPRGVVQAVVSGPLLRDKLNGKIGAYFVSDRGFFENAFDGENVAQEETLVLRGALEYFATEDLTFLAKVEYLNSDGTGPGLTNAGFFPRGSFGVNVDNPGFDETDSILLSLKTDLDVGFGNGRITNIFGFRTLEQFAETDIDTNPAQGFDLIGFTDQRQFSNELRYVGQFGPVSVTAGTFFFQQQLGYDEGRVLLNGASLQSGGGFQDQLVLGAFTTFDYQPNEKLILSAGFRYSFERKDAIVSIIDVGGVSNGVFCSVIAGTCDADFAEAPTFDGFTPRVAAQYFVTDRTQFYTTYSRGFRSGVFNFRSTSPAPLLFLLDTTGSVATNQESLDAVEAGIKHETKNGRGVFNVAAFYTAVNEIIRDITTANEASAVLQVTSNAGDAELFGLEVEGEYALFDNLLLTGNFGYLEANFTDVVDLSGDGLINATDFNLELVRAPRFSWGFGLVHDLGLGPAGQLTTTANFSRNGLTALSDDNLAFDLPQNRLNVDLTWRTPKKGVSFSVYGANLLNNASVGADTQLPPAFGVGPFSDGSASPFTAPLAGSFATLRNGRTLGFELTYNFR